MAVNSANFKEMSGPPFWAATWSLAAGLRRSSVIQAYSAHLPRNAPSRAHGIGGRLQSMRAANANLAPALRLWAETSMWMSSGLAFIHQDDESLSEPDWEHWTALARLVEQSHHLMVGWVRAQLPGYPQLQVPALARGSVLTTREFSWKHRWFREDFGQGWQFGAPPAEICSLLGMARDEGVAVLEALSTVAIALADTAPWRAFSDAFETLGPDAVTELRSARREAHRRLADEQIALVTSDRAVERVRHRASVVDDIVDELGEESKRYAVAFDALNDFVDAALDVVLAQLVCYGLPEAPADLFDLALEPGDPPTARFALNLDTHTLHCDLGELLFVSSDLITEVVVCSALEMSDFGQGRQPRFVVSGQLLEGAAAGWSLT